MIEQLVDSLLPYIVEHPERAAGVVVGVGGVLFSYVKTGKLPIGRIPYRHLRGIIKDLGDRYFGTQRPRGVPVVVADESPQTVKRALENRHYESADLASYEYEGELFNLRRPEGYATDPELGTDLLMENHPRLFACDNETTLLLTHYEPNRYFETKEHLAEKGLSWRGGREIVTNDLDDADIAYTTYETEANADVVVVS